MTPTAGYFHLHLISDSTGETLITVARAAAAQYVKISPVEHVHPLVRSQKQLDRVLTELEATPGIVLYTLLQENLARSSKKNAGSSDCPASRSLDRSCTCSSRISAPRSTHKVGAQHTLNAEYFRRIDALNYTMLHDDGQQADDLEEADVLLIGVSRTSKTPTSIYLANRGVKTANIPLVPGVPLPNGIEQLKHPLVVGLFADAGTHRADPAKPAARPQGASRRRQIYRPEIRGR